MAVVRSMAVELDAGPRRFQRCGTLGEGRCLISAWLCARSPIVGRLDRSLRTQKAECDGLRLELRNWLLGLVGTNKYDTMKVLLFNVGNSGHAAQGGSMVPLSVLKQQSWDTLMEHLSSSTTDLGWECLAVLSEKEHINVLVYTQLYLVKTWAADTKQAAAKWAEAIRTDKAAEQAARQQQTELGGKWVEEECSSTPVLVPRRMRAGWPTITLFHRTQKEVNIGLVETTTAGGLGHYEALVVNASDDDAVPRWTGCFDSGGEVHDHLLRIGTRILAAQFNDIARCRMEIDYNSQSSVVRFKVPNSVGLRVGKASKAGKRRQARGTDSIPCLIIGVNTLQVGDGAGGKQVQHEQYKLLCEFGVVSGTWKVDELVPINFNNFSQLFPLMDSFTAAELMGPDADGWQPIDVKRYDEVSVEEAWRLHQGKKKPATVNASRRRQVELRTSAVAAETAIISSQVETRRAPNLFNSLSSQPVPQTIPSSAPHVVQIFGKNKKGDKYSIEWSNLPGMRGYCCIYLLAAH